jgi:uncharacterized cupin superfamily protein
MTRMTTVESFDPATAPAAEWLPISQQVPYPDELVLEGTWSGEIRWIGKGESGDWRFEGAVSRTADDVTIQAEIEAYEFIYVTRGSLTIALDDGDEATYSAGDAVHLEPGLTGRWTYHAPFEQAITLVTPLDASAKPGAPRMYSIPGASDPASWSDVETSHAVPAEVVLDGEWSGRFELIRNTPDLYSGVHVTDADVKLAALMTGAEFVQVIDGELHVEPEDGDPRVFKKGELVFFEAGYAGTVAYKAPYSQMITVIGEQH